MEQLGADFDLSRMLVVDFMHEVELGVWKALFVHLIRMLYAAEPGGALVGRLNERYAWALLHLMISGLTLNIGFASYLSSIRPSAGFLITYLK